jgi:hypothetical protein
VQLAGHRDTAQCRSPRIFLAQHLLHLTQRVGADRRIISRSERADAEDRHEDRATTESD